MQKDSLAYFLHQVQYSLFALILSSMQGEDCIKERSGLFGNPGHYYKR